MWCPGVRVQDREKEHGNPEVEKSMASTEQKGQCGQNVVYEWKHDVKRNIYAYRQRTYISVTIHSILNGKLLCYHI